MCMLCTALIIEKIIKLSIEEITYYEPDVKAKIGTYQKSQKQKVTTSNENYKTTSDT